MKLNQACILIATLLLPLSTLWLRAADSDHPVTAAQAAQMESVKRQELIFSANQAISDGQRLLGSDKFDEAAGRFQYALDALTNGGASANLYGRAEVGLAAAKAGQAAQLAKDYKFAQAADRLQEAINLQPNNPVYTTDLEQLKQQQLAYEEQVRDPEGVVNNPAVTDEFKDKVAAVQKLLFQGDAYFRTGQYDKSEETYSKILILDPYNKAARDKMDHIEHYKERADGFRHEEYEQAAMGKVDQGWAEAISPDIVVAPTTIGAVSVPSNRAIITRKLQSIIIDKVNFDKLDIATVISFLTEKSKELDPDHEGINFVLRVTSDTPSGPPPATTATPAPAGGPPRAGGGATPPGASATAPAAEPPTIHREVSINLENVPLADILGYVVSQTNLQYTVDDYAVYLRPSIDEGEVLTVRTYLVPPNFFSESTLHVTAPTSDTASSTVENISVSVQQELSNDGIHFPTGATATFLPGSSKLVVRNTPEQLDLISNLIDQRSKETPQVEIEAKIAEFNQDAIKSLTFNYLFGIIGTAPGFQPGVFNSFGAQTNLRTADDAGTTPLGGISPDGINQLIQSNPGASVVQVSPITGGPVTNNTANNLMVGVVINGTGLAAVVNAINNMQGVSLLSAPSVLTQSGLKANIDISREFPYPTSFDKPHLGADGALAYSGGEFAGASLILAIPPTPRSFVTQDVGVSLEVKPTTYPDQRIDLDITKAQVMDFDGFINYGVPIVARTDNDIPPANEPGTVLAPGTINQPVFNLRSVATDLQVMDGQTAVLGGMTREDTQEINDKVPVLGDVPLIGRLFQSKVAERTKKDLLFFITARLIRSNGKPQYIKTLEAEPAEEKLPEPEQQITPGVTLPPLPEETPNS